MLARFESLKKRTHLLDVYLIAQNITVGQGGTITGLNVGLIILNNKRAARAARLFDSLESITAR